MREAANSKKKNYHALQYIGNNLFSALPHIFYRTQTYI